MIRFSSFSDELKAKIREEAINLYVNGYSVSEISKMVMEKYGTGVYYVRNLLKGLPREYKEKHLEAMMAKNFNLYKEKLGEKQAYVKVNQIKGILRRRVMG